MKREDFQVGQTVLYFYGHRTTETPQELTVTKVGRTRVAVDIHGRDAFFKMETGYSVRDFGGFIRTPEYHAELEANRVVHDALRHEFGLTFVGGMSRDIPWQAWAQVLHVLQEARNG